MSISPLDRIGRYIESSWIQILAGNFLGVMKKIGQTKYSEKNLLYISFRNSNV
jgi:hypothetical protein